MKPELPSSRSPAEVFAAHPRATVFAALAAVLLALNLSVAERYVVGDAGYYWLIARTFETPHGFSLAGFEDGLRGYSIPLLVYGIQESGRLLGIDPILVFRVLSAFVGAAAFGVALPSFLGWLFGARLSLLNTASFAALCAVFWRGHLVHPLSDVPALLLVAAGLCALPRPGRQWTPWKAFICGFCLSLSVNVRPIQEAVFFGAVALAAWWMVRHAPSLRSAGAAAGLFLLGAGLPAAPQASVNLRTKGTPNPFAHAPAGQASIYSRQLAWGTAIQRYETNLGGTFPVAAMFNDPAGRRLLGLPENGDPRERPETVRVGTIHYLSLVVRNPLFFASSYARHLFNGLDVAYSTPYVPRLVPRSVPFAALNYGVLCLAAVLAARSLPRAFERENRWKLAVGAVWVLPAVLSVPLAVECRYLISLWMLAHGFAVFRLTGGAEWPPAVSWRTLALAAVGVALCFSLATPVYRQIDGGPAEYDVWCLFCWA